MCDTSFGAINWNGGHETNLIKHNNLFWIVNREFEVERVDLMQMIRNKLTLKKEWNKEKSFWKLVKFNSLYSAANDLIGPFQEPKMILFPRWYHYKWNPMYSDGFFILILKV